MNHSRKHGLRIAQPDAVWDILPKTEVCPKHPSGDGLGHTYYSILPFAPPSQGAGAPDSGTQPEAHGDGAGQASAVCHEEVRTAIRLSRVACLKHDDAAHHEQFRLGLRELARRLRS